MKEFKIFKYPFPVCNPTSVAEMDLPLGAEPLRIDSEDGHAFIWAIVDPNETTIERRKFLLHKTGSTIKGFSSELEAHRNYIGQIALYAEMELMFYVFKSDN